MLASIYTYLYLKFRIGISISTAIVTILDCCYGKPTKIEISDVAKSGINAIYDESRGFDQGEGRFIFASAQTLEEAHALKTGGCSIFTYYLLNGLKGDRKSVDFDGNITPSSLGNYVYDAILNLPSGKRPKQRPIMKMAGADIILAYYPQLSKHRKLEITPELATITSLINEGNEYFVLGEYAEAVKCYNDALYINPSSPSLWIKKGLALNNLANVKAIALHGNVASFLKLSGRTAIQENMDLIELKKYYKKSHAIIIGISKYKEENQLA